MKKLLLISFAAVLIMSGCGSKETGVSVALEEGYECPEEIKTAVCEYYEGSDVSFTEVKREKLTSDEYDAAVGYVNMTSTLGYGVMKSSVIKYENACAAGYEDYRFSYDFSGKKAGIYGEFNLSDYISRADDCEYSEYSSLEAVLSDIKEGAIDVIICTTDTAAELKAADSKLRVSDILESDIYEYVVISSDLNLINSVDKVIGD